VFTAGVLLSALLLAAGVAVTAASFAGAGAAPSGGGGVVLDWSVTAGDGGPAGRAAQPVLLLNGAWLGPVVYATEGETITLTLRNAQSQPLSLHFHGLHQRGTPRADGAARASAAPLLRGESRRLTFTASPVGTHFVHGHAGLTSVQGLHGVIVVRPRDAVSAPSPSPPYDAEAPPLLFSDWWETPLATLRAGLLAPGAAFTWVGNPDALLVNGDDATATGAGAASVALPRGRTLRLRFVSGAALSFLNLAIDGHNMTVIEADGGALAPFEAACVDLNAGERLSVLVTPSDAARAAGVMWMSLASRHRQGAPSGLLALRLPREERDGDAAAATAPQLPPPPRVPLPAQPAWNDTAATLAFYRRFAAAPGVPPPPDADAGAAPLVWVGTQNRIEGGIMRWSLNNVSFVFPDDPLLLGVSGGDAAGGVVADDGAQSPAMVDVAAAAWGADGGGDAAAAAAARAAADAWVAPTAPLNASMPSGGASSSALSSWSRYARSTAAALGTHAVVLRYGAVVDVVLQNAPALNGAKEQHPWHMHGGSFWVLAWGAGDWPGADVADADVAAHPLAPLKDTVTLLPGGWVWLRLRADNPGVWPFHCHIAWHLFMGMSAVLVVAPERIPPA
jgi:L-ascorbate oxidase